ncbi:MAG: Unknown protein [uncultured Sulfurovum sp.]|uniref:Arsenical-resistance protein ACR3 n=1 Tax=uncultured Sulfurovum sp. TaxID=269237 RepID=A0A6S6SHI5_9BACT|nr:MAG: Unknown protein [uncultured Sulfurovum sp.]
MNMQLIVIVILGALFGFIYGANTDGFIFSSNICLFAGLTLIMPSLFKFELMHVKLVWEHKMVMAKGILVNYVIFPIIALIIGFATGDFGITAGLFLVAVLSGGGMVMHWIKKSKGDTSFGFLLLFINLLLISFSLLMLHAFATYTAGYFNASYNNEVAVTRFASAVVILLIVIPLIASRVVRLIKPLVTLIGTYQKYISHISIFIILFYLFGLQGSQTLIDIYDFEPELFFIAFGAVVVFYALTFLVSKFVYNLENAQERAAFWHSITRYLTLALVIATFSSSSFGVSMLLPIMFAYMVQIPLSVYIAEKHFK